MECTNLLDPHQLVCCRIRTILDIYLQQPVPKTDCQLSRRSILDSLGLQRVFRRTNLAKPNAFIWRTISNLEKKRKNRMKCLF
jgi:hypothetical protein